jgi:multidrug resistance efflux pump
MTWLRRVRPVLFILGVALLLGSVVGARALTNASAKTREGGEPRTANPSVAVKAGGPIVLGTVDSDPPPVWYGLPPVLQSGTVAQVFVKGGQEVKAGDPLYEFDTSVQKSNLDRAKVAVEKAQHKVVEAKEAAKQHASKVEVLKQGVAATELKETQLAAYYNLVKSNLETYYKSQNWAPETWPEKLRTEDRLYKANVDWLTAQSEVKLKKADLAVFETTEVSAKLQVKEAEIGVKQAEEEVKAAQTAIDLCTVKAKSAGTVERVTIGQGTTLGVGTRDPALWLIPAGPRVVRAEVEPDFAHRVGADIKGKEVTIFDNTNPQLTYKGKVIDIGGTFLPKRSNGEASLLGNDTRVLEVLVEVADPAPAGKPPLRVGQRVRVSLGQ